jgi:hypothetical protein
MSEFHASKARIRVLIGGRGSGKTTGVAVEVIGHAMHNAGAKIYILRKTQDSNQDTTQETFEQVFRQMGDAYVDTGVSLFKKIEGGKVYRLPTVLAIRYFEAFKQSQPKATKAQLVNWLDNMGKQLCSFVYFAGVPSAQYRASRFRGYECSMLVFVEADQLEREDLDLGVACLRWKGADPDTCDPKGFIRDTCVILDSNPPSPRHWIAELEKQAVSEKDSSRKFWHIPTRENKDNLPPNYVEDLEKQYKNNPAMFQRMLLGEYADAFDGKPVLFAFQTPYHAFDTLGWPKGAYLVRGWDFGTTNCIVWSAYWAEEGDEYWWDLYEYFAEQSDVERQCRACLELTSKVFPFWNDRSICSGTLDFCDVAGTQKKDTGSSIVTVNSYEIYPGYARMGLQESLTIYNRLLERKNKAGKHCYRIDKNTCPMLYTASIGGYRYPNEGEPGFGGNEPLKGPVGQNYDHIADASRYAKMGCLRIIKAEAQAAMKRVGLLAEKKTVNRAKRYY